MAIVNGLTNVPNGEKYFLNNLVGLLRQDRYCTIWFIAALFFVDIIFYFVVKLGRGNIYLQGVFALAVLGIAILFNQALPYTNLVWNIDVSLFGVIFIYFGYLFNNIKLAKIRDTVLKSRIFSLILGIVLFAVGIYFAEANYLATGKHIEMWGRIYTEYYLTIPAAIIYSYGILFISNAVRNKVLVELGKATLVILAFHHILMIPIFNNFIAEGWFNSLRGVRGDDIRVLAYTLCSTVFSISALIPLYYLIVNSPFAFILNRKAPEFYKKAISWAVNKLKLIFTKKNKECVCTDDKGDKNE